MDTTFAKIVSDMDGRDHMLIEGRIITILCGDMNANNEMISALVHGLRSAGRESGDIGGQIIGLAGGTVINATGSCSNAPAG